MSLGHSALAPSGHPIWLDMARRSALALMALEARGTTMRDVLSDASIQNALAVHAAFGGSMNLILHLPAIAHAAGPRRPTAEDWARVSRQRPSTRGRAAEWSAPFRDRPGFPRGRRARSDAAPAPDGRARHQRAHGSGADARQQLDAWESSARRATLRELLRDRDGIDAGRCDHVARDGARSAA